MNVYIYIENSCLSTNPVSRDLKFYQTIDFLEEFDDIDGIDLSEKCVNVSCIVLVSNVSKIRTFY